MKFAIALWSVLFSLFAAAQADRFDKVQIKTTRLADAIYMLEGEGGNIGVSAGEDGVFLIDDQFAPLTPRILAAIKAISDKPVRFLLNTHWHFDHTGGNENLGKSGVVIIRFRNANVIHMGDTYFNGLYPFIDTGTNGSVKGTIAAVDRVLQITDDTTKIIPGHGPLSNKTELKAYREMLAKVSAKISAMAKAKKTLAQVIAAKPTKEYDYAWGKGFLKPEQFVEIVYTSVAKGK